MTQATALKPASEVKTCSQCPNFNNRFYSKSKEWCELFNLPAKTHHEQTNHCILNSETTTADPESFLEDIFANYSPEELEALSEAAFPTEVVELDRDGYPMSDDPVANACFDPNFVTLPNDPF